MNYTAQQLAELPELERQIVMQRLANRAVRNFLLNQAAKWALIYTTTRFLRKVLEAAQDEAQKKYTS